MVDNVLQGQDYKKKEPRERRRRRREGARGSLILIVHFLMVVSLLSQSAGSVGERTSLDAKMPDVCIIYQLHLECGRLINLYDWLQVRATCLDDLLTVCRQNS